MGQSKTFLEANTLERCVSDCERAVIIHALIKTHGDTSAAAQILGTTKRVLTGKIQKYEIDCTQFES